MLAVETLQRSLLYSKDFGVKRTKMMLSYRHLTNVEHCLCNHLRLRRLMQNYKRHLRKIHSHDPLMRYKDTNPVKEDRFEAEDLRIKQTGFGEDLATHKKDNVPKLGLEKTYKAQAANSVSKHKERPNLTFSEKEFPKQILNNYYSLVGAEFNLSVPLHKTQTVLQNGPKPLIQCEYVVRWPRRKVFRGYGNNSSIASALAAKECLNWLRRIGKLTENKEPVLYSEREIKATMSMPVKITLQQSDLESMRDAIQGYKTDIQSIIETEDRTVSKQIILKPNYIYEYPTALAQIMKRNVELKKRLESRTSKTELPITKYKDQIVETMRNSDSLVIIGETGCGKSTQVPQFILDDHIMANTANECNIIITQPRRILAVSLARYVAQERAEDVGYSIGYSIRLEKMCPTEMGNVLYCTPGIVVERLRSDPDLKMVSHVILDEVHERSISTDLLVAMLKRIQQRRPDLKLIFMSATMHTAIITKYFSCPVIKVPGKRYNVVRHFLDDIKDTVFKSDTRNNYRKRSPMVDHSSIVTLIQWISANKPRGAILCFLPQWVDILTVEKRLKLVDNADVFSVIKVHSKLPSDEQMKVYERKENHQKVILSTNIAESGLTVPDIVYVIDTCLTKRIVFNSRTNLFSSVLSWISKGNIQQRMGRAGRTQPGESYHLIDRDHYESLPEHPAADIHDAQLDEVLLKGKVLTDMSAEEFCRILPEPPEPARVKSALEGLIKLGALTEEEKLTNLGSVISQIPLPPVFGKAMVLSKVFHCTHSVTSICTLYSNHEISRSALDSRANVREIRKKVHDSSDHIGSLLVFRQWLESSNKGQACQRFNLAEDRVEFVERIVRELCEHLPSNDIYNEHAKHEAWMLHQDNEYKDEYELIRGVLYAATNRLIKFQPWSITCGIFRKKITSLQAEDQMPVGIKSTSVNSDKTYWSTPFFTYIHRVEQTDGFSMVGDTSLISPLSVILFNRSPIVIQSLHQEKNGQTNVIFNLASMPQFRFECERPTLDSLDRFRDILWQVIDYMIDVQVCSESVNKHNTGKIMTYKNEMLNRLVKLLANNAKDLDNM